MIRNIPDEKQKVGVVVGDKLEGFDLLVVGEDEEEGGWGEGGVEGGEVAGGGVGQEDGVGGVEFLHELLD